MKKNCRSAKLLLLNPTRQLFVQIQQPLRRGRNSLIAFRKCESNLPMPQFRPMIKARTRNRRNANFIEQEIRSREVVLESQPAQLSDVRDDIVRTVGE